MFLLYFYLDFLFVFCFVLYCFCENYTHHLPVGTNIDLKCNYSDLNVTLTVWIDKYNRTKPSDTLSLNNVSFTDAGDYTCQVFSTRNLTYTQITTLVVEGTFLFNKI